MITINVKGRTTSDSKNAKIIWMPVTEKKSSVSNTILSFLLYQNNSGILELSRFLDNTNFSDECESSEFSETYSLYTNLNWILFEADITFIGTFSSGVISEYFY